MTNIDNVIKYNAKAEGTAERYAEIANSIGITGTVEECVDGLCKRIVELNNYMGIPNTLKEFGIIEDEFKEKISTIAENAVGDACTGSNPRPIDDENMKNVLECAFYGKDVTF